MGSLQRSGAKRWRLIGSVLGWTAFAAAGAVAQAPLRPLPLDKGARPPGRLDDLLNRVKPGDDREEWAAEAFADRAGTVLKALATAAEHAGAIDTAKLASLASTQFASPALRPTTLRDVHQDAALIVRRGNPASAPRPDQGGDGLRIALESWLSAYPAGAEVHTKFKIVDVRLPQPPERLASTTAFVQTDAVTPAGHPQQSATWQIRWKPAPASDDPPRIASIAVSEYEEIQPAGTSTPAAPTAPPLFVDAATAILGQSDAWKKNLVHGLDHWFKRVDSAYQIPQGYNGLTIRDVTGDGLDDVYLCQPAGIHNMLLERQPDGTLKDISAASGLDFLDTSRSALLIDLDNDADADAAIGLGYSVMILENNGQGHFTRRARVETGSWMMSMAAADYDLDGRIDLYFCGYSPKEANLGGNLLANPAPIHDANNGARNFLVRNLGAFQFADVTEAAGVDQNNRRFTNAAAWEDYDNDGDPDLFVANDFGRKNLFRNELIHDGKRGTDARFTDVATPAGVTDPGFGMSAAWADYDHDGLMDLYVANMFSSAGRRIASQQKFRAGDTAENRAGLLRLARGNSLFRNRGDGTFDDLGEPSGTVLGRWAWASLFADINNDSWDDLHVANGFYTRSDTDDL